MILLDEMIVASQRQELLKWRSSVRQIGVDVGQPGMKDADQILPLLHHHKNTTFFTSDGGFYDRKIIHGKYCIVVLHVDEFQVAKYIRDFLRIPDFRTKSKRMGHIFKISPELIRFWRLNADEEFRIFWKGI